MGVWEGMRFWLQGRCLAITRPTPLLAPTPWCTLRGVSARARPQLRTLHLRAAGVLPRAQGEAVPPRVQPGMVLGGRKPMRRAWSRSVWALGGARFIWAALDGVELWDLVCAGGSSFGEGSAVLTWRLKLAPGEAVQGAGWGGAGGAGLLHRAGRGLGEGVGGRGEAGGKG